MGATFLCYSLNLAAHLEILRIIIDKSNVKEVVKYHRDIIKLTQKLTKLYKPIIFTEYVVVVTIFCGTGVQMLLYNDIGKILSAMLHATAALVDIAVFAYGGQKVIDASLAVGDDVYKIDKDLILVIKMSQKALKFDTGFFDSSLHTLSIILSRSMSFITLVKSFVVIN